MVGDGGVIGDELDGRPLGVDANNVVESELTPFDGVEKVDPVGDSPITENT